MSVGTVKWFNAAKGYGFIQPEGGGRDIFVHVTAVEAAGMRGLVDGQRLEFDAEKDGRTGKISANNLRTA